MTSGTQRLSGFLLIMLASGIGACSEEPYEPYGSFSGGQITESSGLVGSRTHDDVFWTHNDAGDTTRIFAVEPTGKTLGEVRILGAKNIDWEDIAIDDAGYLYICDCGNNDNDRQDLVVYRVREPDPSQPSSEVLIDRAIHFRYPDQTEFGDDGLANFDAEGLAWANDTLYVLTKHRSDDLTTLYRFPSLSANYEVVLEDLGSVDVGAPKTGKGGLVTGADATTDGGYLAVLTHYAIYVFARPSAGSDEYLSGKITRIDLDKDVTGRCEGIGWFGSGLLFSSESGDIHRITNPLSRGGQEFPFED